MTLFYITDVWAYSWDYSADLLDIRKCHMCWLRSTGHWHHLCVGWIGQILCSKSCCLRGKVTISYHFTLSVECNNFWIQCTYLHFLWLLVLKILIYSEIYSGVLTNDWKRKIISRFCKNQSHEIPTTYFLQN